MTNTKFRKRALLSSVAMLLVALVALGSATFAWFQANPNVTASGLSLKTTAATGLFCRTDSDATWDHDALLYSGQSAAFDLQPASQDQDTPASFYKTTALYSSNYAGDANEAVGTVTISSWATSSASAVGTFTDNGNVYSEKVYFRLSDGAAPATSATIKLTSVSITGVSGANMTNAVRVAIADATGSLIGTYCINNATAHQTLNGTAAKYEEAAFENYGNLVIANGAIADAAQPTVYTGALSASADLAKFVTVYVYLDGEDSDCYSDNVGTVSVTEMISGIDLGFALV